MPTLRRCPWSQITDETWILYSWWRDWKDLKILPYGGDDLSEQPNYVVEAIRQCENIYAKVEAEQVEKSHKEAKQMSRQMPTQSPPKGRRR